MLAEREAGQLDSRVQRMAVMQNEWREEAERGEQAGQALKQARRDLKDRTALLEVFSPGLLCIR